MASFVARGARAVAAVAASVTAVAPVAVAARGSAGVAAGLASASRRAASTWHKGAIDVVTSASAARVEDALVNITFVNYAGVRQSLPGRVGDSLYDVARRYNYEYLDEGCGGGGAPVEAFHAKGSWFEPKYGEGASCAYCHVIIPKSHYHLLPARRPDEAASLAEYPFEEDMTATSRLACQVTLTKEMEGMVVYIPDGPPSDLP